MGHTKQCTIHSLTPSGIQINLEQLHTENYCGPGQLVTSESTVRDDHLSFALKGNIDSPAVTHIKFLKHLHLQVILFSAQLHTSYLSILGGENAYTICTMIG